MKHAPITAALTATLLLLLLPRFTRAQDEVETFEYTVQEGDTCVGIARRFFDDRRRYDLIHAYNPDMGPPPHDLQPGTKLTLPRTAVAASDVPEARVTDIKREVQATEPRNPEWRRAERGLGLFGGWRVNTLEASGAELTFRDTSVIQMRQNTLVVIFGDTASSSRRQTSRAELRNGALRSRLGSLRMEVEMPSGSARLAGGSSVVGVDAEGTTRVSHHDGNPVTLEGEGGGRVRVPAGRGSKVVRGARPTRPRPLPPAPTWRTSPTAFVGLAGDGAVVRGAWEPVENARTYRVEMLQGTALFAAVEVPASVTQFEMHGVPAGEFTIRLATLDDDFFESRPSDPHAIEVSLLDVRAPGASAVDERPLPDPSQPVTEPMLLVGTAIVPPEGVRCALEPGGEPVQRLTAPGSTTLHCREGEQALEPMTLTVVAPALATDEGADEPIRLNPGEPRQVRVAVSSPLPLPEGVVLRGTGVEVREAARAADGSYTAQVVASAAGEGWVELVLGDQVLARHQVLVSEVEVASGEPPPPPVVEPPRTVHVQQALATLRHPALLALRDPAPDVPLQASIGLGLTRTAPDDNTVAIGVFMDVAIIERLRLHVGYAQQLGNGDVQPGAESLFTGLGGVLFDGSVQLRGELAAWWPAGPGDEHVVLAPAFDLGVPLLDERLLLRTRQGALVDLKNDGPIVWASAYGIDGLLVGPLSFGVELDASIGRDQRTGEQLTNLAVAGILTVELGPTSIGLMAQRALTRDLERARGAWRAQLTFGLAIDRD